MTTLQLPDLARADAGTTLISEWIVDTPDRQGRAGRALLEEWGELSARFRPEAFLRLSCFASADGRVLLSVAQWTGDDAHLAFVREHRAEMVGRIDREVPGIRRPGLVRYRLAHTVVHDDVGADTTDVIVARAESGPASDAVQWAEATADRLRASPPTGMGTAHVLVSGDSTRGLLYAPVTQVNDVAGATLYRLLGAVTGPSPGTDGAGPSDGGSAF
ncbi:antibiotic biosynthesis monooxygenase [Streptomyces sp. XM4193]|uniref:antibiotic biosynthesis monooxygenase n=1 Tax=Streptomyces sp. XM4193 TaxID=2929782 RepID=UPI001FF8DCAC|nr:antibiotic biosynthesis monooxygenase [Streptomyces sp. XM4193]MCK1798614.1 antibiotic biosynthesis monooxygenase [Streptomyces sp. XM4193]